MSRIIKILLTVGVCFFFNAETILSSRSLAAESEDLGDQRVKRKKIEHPRGALGEGSAQGESSHPSSTPPVSPSVLQKSLSRHYAVATTDTAFKHMLSLSEGSDRSIIISFLNSFVPAFHGDPVQSVEEAPTALPALRRPGEKQTFMDLHVISSKGVHYIIEMQAQRHIMFDERALFYACSTYARQLSEQQLGTEEWYTKLCPVIALQILDYDTNRARGIKSDIPDTLVARVKNHKLSEDQYTKHYRFIDENSGQQIDHLQLLQVELPRAELNTSLFPPQEGFSTVQWWLSILRYANEYTDEKIEEFYRAKRMPEQIYQALKRLDLTKWDPRVMKEYQNDITRKDLYQTVLAVEREEGKLEGLQEGKLEIARKMLSKGLDLKTIADLTDLSIEDIESLKTEL